MTTPVWSFSPLSCSLMSLLASRTFEWQAWSIAEGGAGEIKPENVRWVELRLDLGGETKKLRCADLSGARALEIFELTKAAPSEPEDSQTGWHERWQSDGFLSEIPTAELPALRDTPDWMLLRGSETKPTLYSR